MMIQEGFELMIGGRALDAFPFPLLVVTCDMQNGELLGIK
jgi:hypothetical protein